MYIEEDVDSLPPPSYESIIKSIGIVPVPTIPAIVSSSSSTYNNPTTAVTATMANIDIATLAPMEQQQPILQEQSSLLHLGILSNLL